MTGENPGKTFSLIRLSLITLLWALSSFVIPTTPALSASNADGTGDSLKVAVFPYLSYAPLYVADSEGFFREQGLDVELVGIRNHSSSLPMLLTEQLDVDTAFTIGLLNAIARGENVSVVANKGHLSSENCTTNGFMVRAGLAEQLENPDPEQLKKFTYGVNPLWLDSYFLDQALQRWDLAIDDVSTKLVANPAARMEALANGSLDVAFFSEPWITRVEESGGGSLWLSVAEIVPNYPLGVIMFGPKLLSAGQNEDVGVRFIRAYQKGVAQVRQGRTDRNVEILSEVTGLPPATLRQVCWSSYDPLGRIDAKAISEYSAWAAQRGLADRSLAPEEFWEPRFIESAAQ